MKSDIGYKNYLTVINYWSWWWEVDNEKDELACTILTTSILILAVFWYRWMVRYSRRGTTPLPPGPRGLPVVGYLPFLSSNLHEGLTELARCYGPIYKLQLGSKLHIVVNSVDLAKDVLRDQDRTFANRDPPVAALVITFGGSDITFSNHNAHWRNMRKLLVSQVLSSANLEACHSFRRDEVRKTVKEVYAKIGTEIDINEISFIAELNVVTSMLWGCSKWVEGQKASYTAAEFREVVFKILELVGEPNVSDFLPVLSRFDLQGVERGMKRQYEHLYRIFDSIIEERIKYNATQREGAIGKDGRKDFLQILLELKEQKDTPFDITRIKTLLLDIVVAATDTTAIMTEWAMAEILNKPKVMKKVQDELTEVIGINNFVEESHLPKLQYLDAVIKETLRLHPALPLLIQRCPTQSCTVGGYNVPKGTIVYVNVWAIHRDPQNWENPSQFKPERFLNDDEANKWDYRGNNLKYFPFGAGRRICPGIPLADKMLMYILASLLHSFEWSLPKGEKIDLSDQFGFVAKKKKPLIAIPSRRLSDASLYL